MVTEETKVAIKALKHTANCDDMQETAFIF